MNSTAAAPRIFAHARRLLVALALMLNPGVPGAGGAEPTRDPSQPIAPGEAAAFFQTEPGVGLELVAAEPTIRSPCAMAWDETGRWFIVENPDYPLGPKPGEPHRGAIIELKDTNGDGRAETRVEFQTGLGFPNGLMRWRGGWLVTDSPQLYWLADTDGDGRADVKEVWFEGFATTKTTQLRACYPTLGPDGWIYVSRGWNDGTLKSPKWPHLKPIDLKDGDFRFRPDGSAAEAIGGNAQFGLVVDDAGRRFMVSNRNPLMHAVAPPQWWRRNPGMGFTDIVQDVAASGGEARVSPLSLDLTTSGFFPELINTPHGGTFTSACGIHQYYGEGFGPEYQGSWLICEPAQNLVQRQVSRPAGPSFTTSRAVEGREFIASRDSWFRPVYATTGPDGALYIADMYRRTIDHPDYLPKEVRGSIDFDSGKEMGRLWRVRQSSRTPNAVQPTPFTHLAPDDLPRLVDHPNLWVRQTATRLIHENPGTISVESLFPTPFAIPTNRFDGGQLTASTPLRLTNDPPAGPHLGMARRLRILGGLLSLTNPPATLRKGRAVDPLVLALYHPSPLVREAAVRAWLDPALPGRTSVPDVPEHLVRWWANDPNPMVRFVFAIACGNGDWEPALAALASIAALDCGDRWTRAAVVSGLHGRERRFTRLLLGRVQGNETGLPELLADVARSDNGRDWPWFLETALATGPTGAAWPPAVVASLLRWKRGSQGKPATLSQLIADHPTAAGSLLAPATAFTRACITLAADPNQPAQRREPAIAFLGESFSLDHRTQLLALLSPTEPAPLQIAAARALENDVEPGLAEALLEPPRWKSYSPQVRERIIALLSSRTPTLPLLLDAVERGDVAPWAIPGARRNQLKNHADPNIRTKAIRVLVSGSEDRRRVYEELKPTLQLPGDAIRGMAVFRRTCASCHTLEGEGARVGPDLTGLHHQPPEALLLHLVIPDAEIYPGFQNYECETTDGRQLSGLLVAETPTQITLRRALGQEETLPRTLIRTLAASTSSLMPSGLETTMTRQELADLITRLRQLPAPR